MSLSADWQAVGELSANIKGLTADYNIATIVASHDQPQRTDVQGQRT